MHGVKNRTDHGQQPTHRRFDSGVVLVKAQDSDRSKVKPIHDVRPCSKIVQLLCQWKVPGVENRAKRPACQTTVSKPEVVLP